MPNPYRRFVTSLSQLSHLPSVRKRRKLRQFSAVPACEFLEDRVLLSAAPTLDLYINRFAVYENEGANAATGTITRSGGDLSQPLTVYLSGDATQDVDFPESVVIAAGETTVTFALGAVDNSLLDGTRNVTLTASVSVPSEGGFLDPSFGTNGYVYTTDSITAAALADDGSFYTVGQVNPGVGDSENLSDLVIRHYHADGSIDTTFGVDGRLQIDLTGERESPSAAVLQADGKLLVAGTIGNGPYNDQMIVRFNADGTLDTTFGQAGLVIRDYGNIYAEANALLLLNDGRFLVAGGINGQLIVNRYLPNGLLDSTFGSGGTFTSGRIDGTADGLAQQADGKIVVVGTHRAGNFDAKVGLLRLTESGAIDSTFGSTGSVLTDLPGRYDGGAAVAIQPDGKIVVAGSTSEGTEFPPRYDSVVMRYTTDGILDTSFGTTGYIRTNMGGNDQAFSIAVEPGGAIVIGGTSNGGGSVLARYAPDGTVLQAGSLPFGPSQIRQIIPLSDGRLMLAGGQFTTSGRVSRYLPPNGSYVLSLKATDSVQVRDYETLSLERLSPLSEVSAGDTLHFRISRSNSDVGQPLTVQFDPTDPELSVPVVTIPAGSMSTDFEVQVLDNGLPEGSRTVSITVSALGYQGRQSTNFLLREIGVTSIEVAADGDAYDQEGDGTFDLMNTSGRSIAVATSYNVGQRQIFMEFDVSSIDTSHRIEEVTLTGALLDPAGNAPFSIEVYAYRGDGVLTLTDTEQAQTKVGELIVDPTIRNYRRWTVRLDSAKIQEFISQGDAVGFVLRFAEGGQGFWSIFSSEGTTYDYNRPQLHFSFSENAPPVFDEAGFRFSIEETAAGGTPIGVVAASDLEDDPIRYEITSGNELGYFTLDAATGVLKVADGVVLDHRLHPSHSLVIRASDGLSTSLPEITVLIEVSRARNEAPSAEDGAFSVPEDSPVGTAIGSLVSNDPDGDSLSFAIVAGNEAGHFIIDPTSGVISIASGLNYREASSHVLTVRVTDNWREPASTLATVTVSVVRTRNEAPTISAFPVEQSVWAGSGDGTVVATFSASDPDGDQLSFEIVSGNAAGYFTLDPARGLIVVAPGVLLPEGEYLLTIGVTDDWSGTQLSARTEVSIHVVRKPLEIGITPQTIDLKRTKTVDVTIFATTDFDPSSLDVSSLTFGTSGVEASPATDKRGRLLVRYEDVNGDGRLDLIVSFETADLGLTESDLGQEIELTLQGAFADGILFAGSSTASLSSSTKGGGKGEGSNGGGRGKKA